jgi:hypothetical protein
MRLIITSLIIFSLSCAPDAPHKNPLDPENPDAKGSIKGIVTTLFGTNPISDAVVTTFPFHKKDTSNNEGKYSITGLKPAVYLVTVEKDRYISEIDTITIEGGEEIESNFQLNGKPTILTSSVNSLHTKSITERYEIIFYLTFLDIDAFIADSAVAESENERFLLQYKTGDTILVYKNSIIYNSYSSAVTLVGIPFSFWVKDLGGSYSDTLLSSLERVIEQSPQIIFPVAGDSISPGDTLRWEPIMESSPIYFILLNIWERYGDPENPVWSSDTLSISDSVFVFTDSIKSGDYEWAVEIHDNFGNCSRCVEWLNF